MKFKTNAMAMHLRGGQIHPDIVRAADDFAHWSAANGLPEPLVSDLYRTRGENTRIYLARYLDLRDIARKDDAGLAKLSAADQELARELRPLTDHDCLARAQDRFSWHCVGAAIDFSGTVYTPAAFEKAKAHLEMGYRSRAGWEFLTHTVVGALPHFHLGRRDSEWKQRFSLLTT